MDLYPWEAFGWPLEEDGWKTNGILSTTPADSYGSLILAKEEKENNNFKIGRIHWPELL